MHTSNFQIPTGQGGNRGLVGRGGEMPYKRKSIIWLLLVAAAFSLGAQLHSEMKPGAAAVLIGICFACELVDSGLGMG